MSAIVDRYVIHPPAASGWTADGDPLDAGSAHIVHHDVTILQHRNVRLVAHAVGPGEIGNTSDDWTDVRDATEPSSTDAWTAIPWTRESCGWVCGPIALAHTRVGISPAGYHPRKIRVVVQAQKSGDPSSQLTIIAALTPSPAPPSMERRLASASAFITDSDMGPWTFSLTLSPDEVVRPLDTWPGRPSTTSEPAQVSLAVAWVWVGWRSDTTGTPDRVDSISVFEVWE